ncbi:MAG: hypothetical protein AAGH15_01470 [Myxococcota bacterium]
MNTWWTRTTVMAALALAGGCGDDAPAEGSPDAGDLGSPPLDAGDAGMADAGTDDAGTADGGNGDDPVYVACGATLIPGEGAAGFVAAFDSLEMGTIDLGPTIEVAGGVNCVAGDGAVYVGEVAAPILTRYDVGPDATFTRGPRLSFAGRGVATLGGFPSRIQLISESKGYLLDEDTATIIVWNPTTMEIVDQFSIEGLGDFFRIEAFPYSGGLLLFTRSSTGTGVSARRTGIGFVDTTNDTVTYDESTACGGTTNAVELPNGDVILASSAIVAAQQRLGLEGAFPPCFIRIPAGTNAVDDDFTIDVDGLTGGPTGELVPGAGSSGFILSYDEALIPIPPDATAGQLRATPAWRLYQLPEIGSTQPGVLVGDVAPSAGAALTFVIDGRIYLSQLSGDFASSTLVDLTDAPDTIAESITVGGILVLVDRVR